jgi:anti-sigma factor RsiW
MSIEQSSAGSVMDCQEMRRSVETYVDGEFDGRELAEANRHLSSCSPCREAVESQRRLRAMLRAKLREAMGPGSGAGTAPEGLRGRITDALARQRRPAWRRVLAPVPVATMAACAAGILVVLWSHTGTDPLIEEAVRKHARDLPLDPSTLAASPEAIPGLLAPRLDFNARPPVFRGQGVKLVGARVAQLRDRSAAYMRYTLPQGQAGLFIVDDPDRRIGETGRAVQFGPATIRVINSRGYNVAIWRRNEIVYSLVADLNENDLVQLAEVAAEEPEP